MDIRVADLPDCMGDPALLRQVFINLLSNAMKFTGNRPVALIEVGFKTEERTNRSILCGTTELASTCDMPTSSLVFFSACTVLSSFQGPAWGSQSFSASSIAMVEGFGRSLRWTKGPRFISPFPRPLNSRYRREQPDTGMKRCRRNGSCPEQFAPYSTGQGSVCQISFAY